MAVPNQQCQRKSDPNLFLHLDALHSPSDRWRVWLREAGQANLGDGNFLQKAGQASA